MRTPDDRFLIQHLRAHYTDVERVLLLKPEDSPPELVSELRMEIAMRFRHGAAIGVDPLCRLALKHGCSYREAWEQAGVVAKWPEPGY